MRVCIIGPGYVGLVTASCLAEMGNEVICVGKPGVDDDRIRILNEGFSPILELGLEDLIRRNLSSGRLKFSLNMEEGVRSSLFHMIAVPTPADEDGSADLKHVLEVACGIGEFLNEYGIVVIKSTVPVGTAESVKRTVQERLDLRSADIEFDVVSNPEFLKEGDAVQDFMKPDRVIVGCDHSRAAELMKTLYAPFARSREKMMVMDVRSSEMTKYAANAMLAARISFMNEIAGVCEAVGADVSLVRKGIGADPRIGYQFTYPGVGFGGSCFPKDLRALIRTAESHNVQPRLLRAVAQVNDEQKRVFTEKIVGYYQGRGGLSGRTVAVWGLAFKPRTNDMREAPSIQVIKGLLAAGAAVRAFDPEALAQARNVLDDHPLLSFEEGEYRALEGADCLVLLTEWFQFRNPDFSRMKRLLREPVIFDGRNQYDPALMKQMGFTYFSIGRPPVEG